MSSHSVIVIGWRATIAVKNGALTVERTEKGQRETIHIDVDDKKPSAILFDSHGEFITGEALRWCARYGVALIIPNGPGRVMTFTDTYLEADRDAATLPDVSPSVIRAQCSANALYAAREIVRAKIAVEIAATVHDSADRRARLSEWEVRIDSARSVAELLVIEAKASADYWRAYAHSGLREAKGGNLPRTWLRFANRQKGAGFLGSKHASHPTSAMLNYAYVVEAGRLARALTARGMALQIGFLHSDKKGRNSLVWDAIEPLRPTITERVFAYIETREFKRSDFIRRREGNCKVS